MSLNAAIEVPAAPVAIGPSGTGSVSWYACLLLGTFTYLVSMQGNILPFLRADLGLGYGLVSLHTSAVAGGMLVVGLIGDRIGRRFGRANTLRLGVLGAGAAAILLCFAPAAWASIASCALLGLFGALVPSTAYALLTDLNPDGRERAFAKANAVSYAFAIAVPILAGVLVALGWNWRLIPLAGVAAGVAILAAHARMVVPDGHSRDANEAAARLPICFWLYWLTLGFAVAVEFSVLLWAPAFLEKAVGMPAAHAAIGAAAFFAAMLSGRIAGIWLLRVASPKLLFFAAASNHPRRLRHLCLDDRTGTRGGWAVRSRPWHRAALSAGHGFRARRGRPCGRQGEQPHRAGAGARRSVQPAAARRAGGCGGPAFRATHDARADGHCCRCLPVGAASCAAVRRLSPSADAAACRCRQAGRPAAPAPSRTPPAAKGAGGNAAGSTPG